MPQHSLMHQSGYLEINHQDSPGVSPADVAHVPQAIAVGAGQVFKADTKQCSHCQATVLLDPLRRRPRGYCVLCHHYICQRCEVTQGLTAGHWPFEKVLDRLLVSQ